MANHAQPSSTLLAISHHSSVTDCSSKVDRWRSQLVVGRDQTTVTDKVVAAEIFSGQADGWYIWMFLEIGDVFVLIYYDLLLFVWQSAATVWKGPAILTEQRIVVEIPGKKLMFLQTTGIQKQDKVRARSSGCCLSYCVIIGRLHTTVCRQRIALSNLSWWWI